MKLLPRFLTVAVCCLAWTRGSTARAGCPEEVMMALQECQIQILFEEGTGKPFLYAGGSPEALCDALKCFARAMAQHPECKNAAILLGGGKLLVWGSPTADNHGSNSIVIATSNDGSSAHARNSGKNSSAYASGGEGGGNSTADATGENGTAGSAAGDAPAGTGEDGGNSTAIGKSSAVSCGGAGANPTGNGNGGDSGSSTAISAHGSATAVAATGGVGVGEGNTSGDGGSSTAIGETASAEPGESGAAVDGATEGKDGKEIEIGTGH